ncbi:hypothetical protein ACFQ7B_43420 [Streptomyces erythrochromogenes]|nr:MAG TPA: hypothetical protein [Caudoviricetes sp.]
MLGSTHHTRIAGQATALFRPRREAVHRRPYLLRYADRIPENHVVAHVELVLRTAQPPHGVRPPYLCGGHFDPGHSTDLPLTWKRNFEDLDLDRTITYVECRYDIFDSFSDAKMDLTARGLYIESIN